MAELLMLSYRDSSFDRPNAAQAAAAYAAGVRVWGGYIAAIVPPGPRSQGGSNLAASWTQADFAVLQAAGIAAVGFCSGWDDAAACGALARAWGVVPMLDCEDAIRGDGPWVDDWLAAAHAGLYGLCSVHAHAAPWHVVARYPGVTVPASSWDPLCPRPPGLLGWQAEGTHQDPATGLQVDGGWVDDGFAAPAQAPRRSEVAMSTSLGPTTSDSFAAGYFSGQPAAASYQARDVWVACAADLAMPGASFPTELRVWFVPFDYTNTGPAPEVHEITLQPSQQVSVLCGLAGEVSVRIEHVSGGTYVARVYEEFRA